MEFFPLQALKKGSVEYNIVDNNSDVDENMVNDNLVCTFPFVLPSLWALKKLFPYSNFRHQRMVALSLLSTVTRMMTRYTINNLFSSLFTMFRLMLLLTNIIFS